MSRRKRLASFLERSGSLSAILKLRARSSIPWLTVLTYHRFPSNEGNEPFDEGVVDVTPDELERQIACLKRHFSVVGLSELCAFAEGKPLPKNPVAVAFDDGYRDNYDIALPILKRHDCKAIFCVATSFVSERRIHWWDRIAYVIKSSPRRELHLSYPVPMRFDLRGPRHAAIRAVLRVVKERPSLHLPTFLAELDGAAGVAWSSAMDRRFSERLLMTWEQVRGLRAAGMDVCSHTRSHRVLQTLSARELEDELEGSRHDLRREVGIDARAIAYPVGNPIGPASPLRAAIAKAGYEIGLTNGTGPTSLRAPVDRFDIRRQTVERGMPHAFFVTILALPRLAPVHPWHLAPDIAAHDEAAPCLTPPGREPAS